jgi:hypothetical protein
MSDIPRLLTTTAPNLDINQWVWNGAVRHYREAIIHLYDGFTWIESCP